MRATMSVDSERINGTCFVVNLTSIEVCEDSGWREICDADFTDDDAEVICRQLNYSDIGKFKPISVCSVKYTSKRIVKRVSLCQHKTESG